MQQPVSVRLARIAGEQRRLAQELRDVEQLKKEMRTNPALRYKLQLEAHQELGVSETSPWAHGE